MRRSRTRTEEEFLQKVSDLCLKIAGLLPEKEKTGDIEELESAVRDEYDYRTLSIDNLKEHLKENGKLDFKLLAKTIEYYITYNKKGHNFFLSFLKCFSLSRFEFLTYV